MIISCSRRTDVPAFYPDWLIKRLRDGFCLVPNPMNSRQVAEVSLKPEDVDAIVFWTKNPAPMIPLLKEIEGLGYKFYFQFTLNDYPREFEPGLPPVMERIETFKRLSSLIGAERVVWRYDPIILSNVTPVEYHTRKFQAISMELKGWTRRCVISVVDIYRKTEKRLRELEKQSIQSDFSPLENPGMKSILNEISGIAGENGIQVFSCAEGQGFKEKYGIECGKCIDDSLVKNLFGIEVSKEKDKYQRDLCGCISSKDIGMNNTCLHGCAYCYSTRSQESAEKNRKLHNPDSPALIGNFS
jgi:DNA repair photolyase